MVWCGVVCCGAVCCGVMILKDILTDMLVVFAIAIATAIVIVKAIVIVIVIGIVTRYVARRTAVIHKNLLWERSGPLTPLHPTGCAAQTRRNGFSLLKVQARQTRIKNCPTSVREGLKYCRRTGTTVRTMSDTCPRRSDTAQTGVWMTFDKYPHMLNNGLKRLDELSTKVWKWTNKARKV